MPLDDDALTTALANAARAAFESLRAKLPEEQFYCYSLYTTPEYRWISPLVFGVNGLRQIATDYDPSDVEAQMTALRWSAGDSPYLEMGEEHFDEVEAILAALPHIYDLPHDEFVDRVERVHACCIAALRQLDADGLFGTGADREAIVLNILQGDQSNRSRLDNAAALNPKAAWEPMAADLPVTREVGTFTTRGEGLYQANDLATCGDGIAIVAAKRALAWRDEQLLVDVELTGNAWNVAVAERGMVTVVEGEVLWLAFDGGEPVQRERHEARMGALAVSRDGRLLIWAGRDGELSASRDGAQMWRTELHAADVELSVDGERAYAAGEGVHVFDVSSGDELVRLTADVPAFRCVAVSAAGAVAAGCDTVGKPGRLVLWSASGEHIANLSIPDPLLESAKSKSYRPTGCIGVSFSPDGARVASAHTNGELHVWDAATGEHLTTVRGRHESLSGCGWLDDRRVALAGRDVDSGPAVYVFEV